MKALAEAVAACAVGPPEHLRYRHKDGVWVRVTEADMSETEMRFVPPGEYALIAVEPCHIDGIQSYANGTHVVTIKGRTRP